MRKAGRNMVTLAAVLLLVLTAACAPAPMETTPAPTPSPGEVTTPPSPEPTPGVESGIIEIRVTDPPPAEVKSAFVYLTNIEVHQVSDNASGWITISEFPPSFDLMAVVGVEEFLGSGNVTAGKFTQIRMDVDRVEVVIATDNTTANITAEVPSGKLKIVTPFTVEGGIKTILTLDFNGAKSLVVTGKERALFKPVVKLLIEKEKVK